MVNFYAWCIQMLTFTCSTYSIRHAVWIFRETLDSGVDIFVGHLYHCKLRDEYSKIWSVGLSRLGLHEYQRWSACHWSWYQTAIANCYLLPDYHFLEWTFWGQIWENIEFCILQTYKQIRMRFFNGIKRPMVASETKII